MSKQYCPKQGLQESGSSDTFLVCFCFVLFCFFVFVLLQLPTHSIFVPLSILCLPIQPCQPSDLCLSEVDSFAIQTLYNSIYLSHDHSPVPSLEIVSPTPELCFYVDGANSVVIHIRHLCPHSIKSRHPGKPCRMEWNRAAF